MRVVIVTESFPPDVNGVAHCALQTARHAETGDVRVVEQLRRLAADPAEEAEVQTAVRSRIAPEGPAV